MRFKVGHIVIPTAGDLEGYKDAVVLRIDTEGEHDNSESILVFSKQANDDHIGHDGVSSEYRYGHWWCRQRELKRIGSFNIEIND